MSEINYLEKVENHHLKTLEENGLQLTDLPKELRGEFNVLKFMLKNLEKNPTDERQYIALEKKSLLVADKVQDFYEKDFSEEDEEDEAEKERLRLEAEAKEKEEADEKARLDQEEKDRLDAEAKEKKDADEKARLDQEEKDRLEAEAKEKEDADKNKKESKKPVEKPSKKVSETTSNEEEEHDEEDEGDSAKSKKPKDKPEEKPKSTDGKFGTYGMEQKIRKILEANDNRIGIRELQAIIGQEPDYPEQKVFNLRLRKVLNYSLYREY